MSFQKPFDTLFLDRDGVLNVKIEDGYVTDFSEIEILPGIPEFLAWAKENFTQILVITNQRCVGRGIITQENLRDINQRIHLLTGEHVDHFFFCPHLTEDHCACRKPKQGLFLQAASLFPVDFTNSWMVGDSESDLIPAKRLGCSTVFLSAKESSYADHHLRSTQELLPFFQSLSGQ